MRQEIRKELEALFRLAREEGLGELRVDRPDFRLVIRRGQPSLRPRPKPPAVAPGKQAPPSLRERPRPGRPRVWQICSPLIGIFYRSSSPDRPPFVEVGDAVTEGQTVCLVEAMKVFNEIPSERRGRVSEILAASGDLVEDGQVLFVLELE